MTVSAVSRRGSRRRIRLCVLALVTAALAGVVYWQVVRKPRIEPPPFDPPPFDTAGVDRAVVRSLEEKREAVRQSRSASSWGELGMTFYVHNFASQALTCFREAEKLQPHEPRWPYFQALTLTREKSIGKFKQAVHLCGDNLETPRLRLAETLFALDKMGEAAEQFGQTLAKDPENALANLGMARVTLKRGDLEQSLDYLSHAVKNECTRKAAQLLLAQVHQARGETEAAAQASRKAQRLPADSPWPDPYYEEAAKFLTGLKGSSDRAKMLLRSGKVSEAVDLLKQTTSEYPQSDLAFRLLGHAYMLHGDLPAAEVVLKKAVELVPNSTDGIFRLGVVLMRQERTAEAIAQFRRAIDLQPGYGEAYYNIGQCLLKQSDRSGALDAFRTATQRSPQSVLAHQALGTQLAESGKHREAVAEFREALKLDPDDRTTQDLLQRALNEKPH
jgi:tetratricopeptide (TPR) repeat protein